MVTQARILFLTIVTVVSLLVAVLFKISLADVLLGVAFVLAVDSWVVGRVLALVYSDLKKKGSENGNDRKAE